MRVDIITSVLGCTFSKIWMDRRRGSYGRGKVFFIGINELIKNKIISKRRQDEIDLDILLLARQRLKKKRA